MNVNIAYLQYEMLSDKVDLPKAAKVQIELRCHFDETNAFGGVLLADAVVAVSSLTHFSTGISLIHRFDSVILTSVFDRH